MSAHRRVVLTCDHPGCLQSYAGELQFGVPGINSTRNQSREAGWRPRKDENHRRLDYCPEHAPAHVAAA